MAKKHGHRSDLVGEHELTDTGQIIGLCAFMAVWIPDSFVFNFSTFLSVFIPLVVRIPLGGSILFLACVMAYKSHQTIFSERRDPPVVITKGAFRFVRHPLYLSGLIAYLGLFFITFSLFSLLIIAGIFFFLNFAADFEEKKLLSFFGKQYADYRQRVGKWIPKLLARRGQLAATKPSAY